MSILLTSLLSGPAAKLPRVHNNNNIFHREIASSLDLSSFLHKHLTVYNPRVIQNKLFFSVLL